MVKIPLKYSKVILIALFTVFFALGVFWHILTIRERNALSGALTQINVQFEALEEEKQNLLRQIGKEEELNQVLSRQNSELKSALGNSKQELDQLKTGLSQLNKNIEELNAQISGLKTENLDLAKEKAELKQEIAQVSEEKAELKARLGSIAELKKAIRQVKNQMRSIKLIPKLKPRQDRPKEAKRITKGNHGFLWRNGESTYHAKIKIEVNPAP
ncbi:MAG: hypothetical protein JW788_01765 [Candidatus Omnitrophica bacterium]|nr:hypothetical protein [Candidatus Omnitrophota bacterium]